MRKCVQHIQSTTNETEIQCTFHADRSGEAHLAVDATGCGNHGLGGVVLQSAPDDDAGEIPAEDELSDRLILG